MNKIAILIGHRSKAKGAYSTWLDVTEYDYMKKVASYCTDFADVYERPNTPFVSEGYRIGQALKKINKKRYNLVLSLHFNSFSDERAHGVTALHNITNTKTKGVASQFMYLVNQRFGIKKRDLIPISSKNQNGGKFILDTTANAVLLEPFFGSNPVDSVQFCNAEEKYANLLRDLV